MDIHDDTTLSATYPKWLVWSMIGIAFLGFADATYLTNEHYFSIPLPCTIFHGCETVLTSPYSVIFGIPVALLGVLYYLTVFILLVCAIDMQKKICARLAMVCTPLGFLASLYFVYLQIFVIKALCLYCMVSATTSTILFILGMIGLVRYKEKNREIGMIKEVL